MAANQPSSSTKEYVVRIPKKSSKKHMVMKFNPANNVDFTKISSAKIERENNFKSFKISHDIDQNPKFGAGSEFGREQKEEARRKKHGIQMKRYNPNDQPWMLKLGSGKQARKFKGSKEGSISENTSYYIFTQCPDGAFEAHLVDEFYNFAPIIKYKYLNAEEAEDEFSRRDKTINYFSIMVKKRLKNTDGSEALDDDETDKKQKKGGKKKSSLKLTEMEDWESDDSPSDDSDKEKTKDSDDDKPKKKKKGSAREKSRKVGNKMNSDDEAIEEDDSMDEGEEVDYITDSDSDDEGMYDDTDKEKTTGRYKHKGVEDEDDLRKMISSDEESDEEKKEGEEQKEGEKTEGKEKTGSASESSSSSESDSDPEQSSDFTKALFMQKSKKLDKRRGSGSSEASTSRPGTPSELAGKKRKQTSGKRESPVPKKSRPNSRPGTPTNAGNSNHSTATSPLVTGQSTTSASTPASDGITDDAVRRYLARKPMTTTDLVQKFRNKYPNMSKDTLVTTIAHILKRIPLHKETIKDKLYLSIKNK